VIHGARAQQGAGGAGVGDGERRGEVGHAQAGNSRRRHTPRTDEPSSSVTAATW
jgi:hypothetical protein